MAVAQPPTARSLEDHRRQAGAAVDAAIAAAAAAYQDYASIPEVRALRDATPDELRSIVIVLLDRATSGPGLLARLTGNTPDPMQAWQIGRVLGTLASKRPPYTREDARLLLGFGRKALGSAGVNDAWTDVGLAGQPVVAAERAVAEGGVGELAEPIRGLAEQLGKVRAYGAPQAAKYRARLLALLSAPAAVTASSETPTNVVPFAPRATVDPKLIRPDDVWGKAWRTRASGLSGPLAELVVHCSLASGVVPSAAWRKRARELVQAPGADEILHGMLDDTMAAAAAQTSRRYQLDGRTYVSWDPALVDSNVVLVRGAMWAAANVDAPWVDESLLAIGLHFGTSGGTSNEVRDERLANTAAAALGSRGGPAAIAALGRLKAKIGNRNVTRQIIKALDAASAATGISPSELLELAVPTNGLDAQGRREVPVAGHTALLAIDGDGVSLSWRAPDGRVTSTVPVALAEHRAAVAAIKDEAKELRKALGLERGRIEELFTEDREWSVVDWQARYLDHPVTSSIARRLIWTFLPATGADARAAMRDADGFLDATGRPVEVGPDDRVRTWHPIDATEAEVAAWRSRLFELRMQQPFKQAFREVYRITPAEEQTERYSNRFAAHILSYPQARALMTARRWGSNFLGPYDGGYHGIAKREFPTHGIRVEFWHDAIEEDLGAHQTSVEHCSTDQVRFLGLGRVDELMPLRDVPPIVFSEAMRDVDLFVSVTSVGADRVWQDGGLAGVNRFGGYWGESWERPLTSTAAVRRDALARMLPGLAIADRLELEDRWLVVRGDLRSYKIHLGSGNILMMPADTYLCIVPDRGRSADSVFLPFDDDPTLSMILSKAFLLARDSRISDRSITAQIKRG